MKAKLLYLVSFIIVTCNVYSAEHKVFHTSICYDFLSSIQYSEKLLQDSTYFANLQEDTTFTNALAEINATVRASNLCNLYSALHADKDNLQTCISVLSDVTIDQLPARYQGEWLEKIFAVKPALLYVLNTLYEANYEKYWHENVLPMLAERIQHYTFKEGLLDAIHTEINNLAGNEPLSTDYSKIYILDINNSFALLDETFCCTSLLLDKELAKQYRINFIQVYIHENLHRLYLSPALLDKLNQLHADPFYHEKEQIALQHNEGQNEAFVVAAETYISHKLGLKTKEEVYAEFMEYIDGSLVVAPIVYTHLKDKKQDESFNQFLLRLFEENKISVGHIKDQYEKSIAQLQ